MVHRFEGPGGKEKLIEAIVKQAVVSGDRAFAERLIELGVLVAFAPGEIIIEQGGDDDDAYFLIEGRVGVFVHHQRVAERRGGELVGEMAAVDSSSRRSATLKAEGEVAALRLSAAHLKSAAESSPGFWRYLFQAVATRLRERAKLHLPANKTPVLFVGSSVEGLPVAREIEKGLMHDHIVVRMWSSAGVFGPSGIPVDELITRVDEADFALFVFGPEDKITSRAEDYMGPRDNVVFEMGLFIGRLGRNRVFMVKDHDVALKIPSDLTGVSPITYKRKPGSGTADWVGPVCTDLRRVVTERGAILDRMKAP